MTRRELNEIEYFNWCVGQPYNMVVAVELRGVVAPNRLRAALDQAQRRHPLLGVTTELGANGTPWFTSEGVGTIPLTVVEQSAPDDAAQLLERELQASFLMNERAAARPPLLRVSLLLPRDASQPTSLVLTIQHVVADGLSMVFLVRDLLHFVAEPSAPLTILNASADPTDLLPAKVRRRVAKTALPVRLMLWLIKLYVRLRYGKAGIPARQSTFRQRAWQLTPEQTSRLRARCRLERVSLHSAICTACLPNFGYIHTPVNLRALLARPVGESVGLFVGAAEVRLHYRAQLGFWDNARRFQRKLRAQLRDPFRVFRFFSKAVPPELVREVGMLLAKLTTNQRAFAVTNLGQLDDAGIQLGGPGLKVESFIGAVSAIAEASVLTVYTIGGSLRIHLLANETPPSDSSVRDAIDRSVRSLLEALD